MWIGVLSFLLLCVPTIWELRNDANGDANKKQDVLIRATIMLGVSFMCVSFGKNFFTSLNLSVAIHFAVFDYFINIILYHNNAIDYANWFSYSSKSGVVDNIGFWRKMNPWGKFAIRLGYFIIAIILYVTI